ncbi:hypothetical protein [Oceanibacterium hippocampi]|uniref:Uncharacterized protein n=1 Tax=Oceanibacterium hippocampi TaxID=745714 RepID=A0A1Y5S388_9PROT|nr:hypothetical protein [Oceanibacterium hippocampi]SLN31338.1 hypothetical protein OCH7691_01118 [Oceanibacterium hippocampi]
MTAKDRNNPGRGQGHGRDPDRESRLAEKLRDNLHRRKAQARARGTAPAPVIKNRPPEPEDRG